MSIVIIGNHVTWENILAFCQKRLLYIMLKKISLICHQLKLYDREKKVDILFRIVTMY